jgi:hypothetical protein
VLIYLTKQDLKSTKEEEIRDLLKLDQLKQPWKVQQCEGIKGEGVKEGF